MRGTGSRMAEGYRMAHGSGEGRPEGRGLVLKNIGGALGWAVRRRFPGLATRVYLGYIRLTRSRGARRRVGEFMRRGGGDWFTHVEIETVNRCNGHCAFCPVRAGLDPRPFRRMPESLFERILDQLAAIDYGGYLGLFSNNEPLLDDRLTRFAAEARARLPRAFLNLSTNGILLDVPRLGELLPHFDQIVVNNYHDRPELLPPVRALRDFCMGDEGARLLSGKTVVISLRHVGDVLTSRGGSAPNRPPPARPPASPCVLPFTQMVVRPDGGVSLCCNDALGRVTLGDLSAASLRDVWFGSEYIALRRVMAAEGRAALPLCRECDFVKHEPH